MKNLLNKIDKINGDIDSINESIDNLLSEQFNPWAFIVRRLALNKIFGDDEEEEGLSKKEKEDKLKKSYDDWLDSDEKENDIEELVDDIKDISNEKDNEVTEEFREMLISLAKQQKEILQQALSKKGFDKLTVRFNEPIEFELRRGEGKGEKLKLEKTKSYDVFMVDDTKTKNKIYFSYKDWLKKYSIMFLMEIKNPELGEKYDRVSIYVVYVNDNFLRDQKVKIIEEKILTHRAMVEIKSLN
jgi:hypothetical protein